MVIRLMSEFVSKLQSNLAVLNRMLSHFVVALTLQLGQSLPLVWAVTSHIIIH